MSRNKMLLFISTILSEYLFLELFKNKNPKEFPLK